jgi:hypothetical protein
MLKKRSNESEEKRSAARLVECIMETSIGVAQTAAIPIGNHGLELLMQLRKMIIGLRRQSFARQPRSQALQYRSHLIHFVDTVR